MKNPRLKIGLALALTLWAAPLAWAQPAATLSQGWVLYDDFDSGRFDPNRWSVTEENGTISVEAGRLKVVHRPGQPGSLVGLRPILWPERIVALRAEVTMASAVGDLRARLHGWLGQTPQGNLIRTALHVRPNPDRNYIHGWLGEHQPDETWVKDLFWGYFQAPIPTIGPTFLVTLSLDPQDPRWSVAGQGSIRFDGQGEVLILPLTDPAAAATRFLGTKANDALAEGVVYFDNVSVQYK